MARKASRIALRESTRTTGLCRGSVTTVTAMGSAALAVPATNLSERTGITFNNIDGTNSIYLWWSLPEYIRCSEIYVKDMGTLEGANYTNKWKKSATGNEWYAVSSTGSGTPAITQPVVIYYATLGGGAETLAVSGTVGTLSAEHKWGWGDGDTLGYSTVYVRTDGAAAANRPEVKYDYLLSYTAVPTTSTGYQLLKGTSYYKELDGAVRTFGIAAAGTPSVTTVEDL